MNIDIVTYTGPSIQHFEKSGVLCIFESLSYGLLLTIKPAAIIE
jgi:hypothetical protein